MFTVVEGGSQPCWTYQWRVCADKPRLTIQLLRTAIPCFSGASRALSRLGIWGRRRIRDNNSPDAATGQTRASGTHDPSEFFFKLGVRSPIEYRSERCVPCSWSSGHKLSWTNVQLVARLSSKQVSNGSCHISAPMIGGWPCVTIQVEYSSVFAAGTPNAIYRSLQDLMSMERDIPDSLSDKDRRRTGASKRVPSS